VLPVFVYGTLRPGSWNHDRWLAPWLAGRCRPAQLAGHALHHHGGLPYVVPDRGGRVVEGHVADLDRDRYDAAMAKLDELEDVERRHYDRVTVTLVGGERAWVWVAGPAVAAELGAPTLVAHGDWLRLAG
jgi:periplasmic divalent cation tolerance protein